MFSPFFVNNFCSKEKNAKEGYVTNDKLSVYEKSTHCNVKKHTGMHTRDSMFSCLFCQNRVYYLYKSSLLFKEQQAKRLRVMEYESNTMRTMA